MQRMESATYEQSDEEVSETATAAIAYILEGDPLNEVYDLRGLTVFGVIGALRENDELFYGDDTSLSQEQRDRLTEVETVVDAAVTRDMHYYPFGDNLNKHGIDAMDFAQLSAITRDTGKARISSKADQRYLRSLQGRSQADINQAGPVTTSRLSD